MVSSIFGIIIILFLVVRFGDKILINMSLLLAGKGTSEQSQQNTSPTYLASPIINPLTYSATNSAQISVTGLATNHETIELYVNDDMVSSKETKDDGSFTFQNVTLNKGDNEIKAKAKSGKKTSDYSDKITVSYKDSPVTLTVDNPHDGDTFSKDQNSITISGKTDSDAKITVNDFWAIVDSNGGFTYNLKLHDGENHIRVVATDSAGNKTTNELKVNYSP